MALHHIELNVSDLKTSEEFYGWLLGKLGYHVYQKWNKGQSWKKGGEYIVIVQAEEKYMPSGYHRKHVGLNHLAFGVDSRKKINAFMSEIEERRINRLYSQKYPNYEYYAVYFEDPDRIKIELIAQ